MLGWGKSVGFLFGVCVCWGGGYGQSYFMMIFPMITVKGVVIKSHGIVVKGVPFMIVIGWDEL